MAPASSPSSPVSSPPATFLRCRLCSVLLGAGDNKRTGFCVDCQERPQARQMLAADKAPAPAKPQAVTTAPPAFTIAERSLIAHTGPHLPAAELLKILNERLVADRGPGVVRHTLEQLQAELQARTDKPDTGWGGLRRLLGRARKDGLLEQITPQVIDDFAIVFQLTAAQVTHLRDVIASAREE